VRIIGGSLRSRKFEAPRGMATRPTADRAKVALFNILQGRLSGARVLDGFAGSGALSFESVSRGASMAVLFEADAHTAELIRGNAAALGIADHVDARHADFLKGASALSGQIFDIVFLDPPYASGLMGKALEAAEGLLAPGGVVVAEHSAAQDMPDIAGALARSDHRRYGAVAFSFYIRRADG
jgi:16S rRNA (guanine966-N2)-methyltransferase